MKEKTYTEYQPLPTMMKVGDIVCFKPRYCDMLQENIDVPHHLVGKNAILVSGPHTGSHTGCITPDGKVVPGWGMAWDMLMDGEIINYYDGWMEKI